MIHHILQMKQKKLYDIQDPRLTDDTYTLDEVEETIDIQDPRLTDDTYTLDEVEETIDAITEVLSNELSEHI